MKTIRANVFMSLLLLFCVQAIGQNRDSIQAKLSQYVYAINAFSEYIPQEKVYLHFDNNSYYQGDNIWFKCYIVTSGLHQATRLSKTLYVELLNPGGEIIDKRILKIENGQCHGDFALKHIPFYSGFYEVRAYTKYMLNYGDDVIFSRLLPVFEKPKVEGDFEEREIRRNRSGGYPIKRAKPVKEKKVNLRFYPEGGNLVMGLTSQVAFEATDEYGNPIDVTGSIINGQKEETSQFASEHEGRGIFSYTPGEEKQRVVADYKGKKYRFDLPAAQPQGLVMGIDNLSDPDSLSINIQKSKDMPVELLALAVITRSKPQKYCLVDITEEDSCSFKIDKTKFAAGVSRIVLFNHQGEILCDRQVFNYPKDSLIIQAQTEKSYYAPFEPVEMEFTLTDNNNLPAPVPFSVSVRDGMHEVDYRQNILTDLLLMSDIKGYVRNPSYYFEADDIAHRKAMDLLLRIQGWRRYIWDHQAGIEPLDLKYLPEQGIETQGEIVSLVRKTPKPNVDVSFFLLKRGDEEEEAASFVDLFVTDSLGRFSFVSDIYGKWNMILAVTEKKKKKDHRIILNRLFAPEPRRYIYAEMQIDLRNRQEEEEKALMEEESADPLEEDFDKFFTAYEDSLKKKGIDEKIHRLQEVTVKAKKRTKESEIFDNRSKSIAYYDVHSEWDNIKDSGEFIGKDIHQFLLNTNEHFSIWYYRHHEFLHYKNKMPLFIVDYQVTEQTEMDYFKYKLVRLEAIKSIYISENYSSIYKYADPRFTMSDVMDIYSCAVFIETYPEGQIPTDAGKGVRKTTLDGYNHPAEFYNPDYSVLPPEPDYRRTLYWNPMVMPDSDGKAQIRFYNNSRCRKFSISAEAITPQGVIGTALFH
ncbi:hypothetical protein LJC44_05240 [Parabacteroides sp. OttesenSCG-928-G06]|nr:hypothetical protein [Parabacteroides sp. OttesenSCG-928-G06]